MTVPNQIRLFRAGWNKTSKGNFLFDNVAAKAVMSEYQRAGVDVMIDLEHLSLDKESNGYNPDAQAWCKLELRGGELWATRVEWTPEGAQRLEAKKQRYVSPTFSFDSETHRILSIYNIAICAIPATYDAPALVAASKRAGNKNFATLAIEVVDMDEALKKVAVALGLADDATLEDILAAIKVMQEDDGSGDGDTAATSDDDGDAGDGDTAATSDDAMLSSLPKAAQALFAGLSAANENLRKRMERQEKATSQAEVERLMTLHADVIPLRFEKWLRGQTPQEVREFVKLAGALPKDKPLALAREPERPSVGGGDVVTLTPAEQARIEASGTPPEKFLAAKKKIQEREKKLKGA